MPQSLLTQLILWQFAQILYEMSMSMYSEITIQAASSQMYRTLLLIFLLLMLCMNSQCPGNAFVLPPQNTQKI